MKPVSSHENIIQDFSNLLCHFCKYKGNKKTPKLKIVKKWPLDDTLCSQCSACLLILHLDPFLNIVTKVHCLFFDHTTCGQTAYHSNLYVALTDREGCSLLTQFEPPSPLKKIPKMVYNRCARCNLCNFQILTLLPLLTI